jgi:hypothetical protein
MLKSPSTFEPCRLRSLHCSDNFLSKLLRYGSLGFYS